MSLILSPFLIPLKLVYFSTAMILRQCWGVWTCSELPLDVFSLFSFHISYISVRTSLSIQSVFVQIDKLICPRCNICQWYWYCAWLHYVSRLIHPTINGYLSQLTNIFLLIANIFVRQLENVFATLTDRGVIAQRWSINSPIQQSNQWPTNVALIRS